MEKALNLLGQVIDKLLELQVKGKIPFEDNRRLAGRAFELARGKGLLEFAQPMETLSQIETGNLIPALADFIVPHEENDSTEDPRVFNEEWKREVE